MLSKDLGSRSSYISKGLDYSGIAASTNPKAAARTMPACCLSSLFLPGCFFSSGSSLIGAHSTVRCNAFFRIDSDPLPSESIVYFIFHFPILSIAAVYNIVHESCSFAVEATAVKNCMLRRGRQQGGSEAGRVQGAVVVTSV